MLGTDAHPVPAGAGRDIARIAYTSLIRAMDGWLDAMHVHTLFRDVFGERRPFDTWLIDLEDEFANMVNDWLFPVDIEAMNTYLEMEEDPFNAPIPLSGWRIPWEVCDSSDLEDYQQPVAEILVETNDGEDDWGPAWLKTGAPGDVVEANLARIAALDAPLSGLADLVRLAIGPSRGNPFLDLPGAMVACEYMDWDTPWFWDKNDIEKLAGLYDQARPIVERIEAFRVWFDADTGEADTLTLRTLWGTDSISPPPFDGGGAGEGAADA